MKILPVTAELFHVDRRTNRYDEANSWFSQFCICAKKCSTVLSLAIGKEMQLERVAFPVPLQAAAGNFGSVNLFS